MVVVRTGEKGQENIIRMTGVRYFFPCRVDSAGPGWCDGLTFIEELDALSFASVPISTHSSHFLI